MNSKKLGRPKLEKTQAKAVIFHVRVTQSERLSIKQSAKAFKSESEWARAILLQNVSKPENP